MTFRRPLAAALAAGAIAAAAAVATAAPGRVSGLHDARYCEILEVKGAPPAARVVVWNTVGLGSCPAAWWNAFDAGALAGELGDTAVVLNGPRHFLMDSASDPRVGPVRAFHGVRLRRVATIRIRTAAELTQTPYTDRTIARDNTWRWKRGRTVFELVAPGGDTYLMQSYAQIADRTLRAGDLRSLGRRLHLPTGWRYRARRLRRPLALTAHGRATIIQDELGDTYQLATTTRRGRRARHAVALTGRTHTVQAASAGTVEDHGTVTGAPFGKGSIVLVGRLANGRLEGTFRLTFPRGSVIGSVSAPFTVAGGEIDFRGTSRFTGGTGAYRGILSTALAAHDHNTLDGQNGRLSVAGSATY